MTEGDESLFLGGRVPIAVISSMFLLAVYFLATGENSLAAVFACYGIVLLQTRLKLWLIVGGFRGAPTLRRLLRLGVFFLPIIFLGPPILNELTWGVLAGIACGAIFLLARLPELRFNLSGEFIAILPPLSPEDKFREVFSLVFGAVGQEYFYRGVVLYALVQYLGIGAVVVSAVFFTIEHLLHAGAQQTFDRRDYLLQTLLALSLGGIFYFSESLLGCMLGHVIYNAPGALQTFRRSSSAAEG